ncbi:MAG: permease-like cell division protein FtsX [bacterium]|nr:permease-like cell division protein FtsX [bacterium]
MFISFLRLLKYALVDFARNIWLSMTTVVMLTLTLISVQVLLGMNVAGRIALDELGARVDLRIQFRPTVAEDEVDAIRTQLLAREEVLGITHISRAQVFEEFTATHRGNDDILEAIAELGENPFGPELRIQARTPEDFPILAALLDDPQLSERIIETGAGDRALLVERLNALTAKLRYAGLAMSGLSFLVTLLIIINAMRVITYVRRDEVGIMKLVGATNWFVRTPFLIMGVLAAAIATVITQLLTFPALQLAEPTLRQFLGARGIDIATFFHYHLWEIAAAEFLGLALLTTTISAIAIRRYLRV